MQRWLISWMRAVCLAVAIWAGLSALSEAQRSPAGAASTFETTLVSLGRSTSRRSLTLTAKVQNKGSAVVYLALGGPAPKFIDGAGGRYSLNTFSGLARCPVWDSVGLCVGVPQPGTSTLPLQGYTRLDPGQVIHLIFDFSNGDSSRGPLGTFAASALFYGVADEARERTLSEAERRSTIRLINLSFPPMAITDAP